MTIPPGYRIKNVAIDGKPTSVLVAKRRTKKFKLPAKTRKKIAASARKFKVPLLTGTALAIPAVSAYNTSQIYARPEKKVMAAAAEILASYTGIYALPDKKIEFRADKLLQGAAPLLGVWALKRSGIFRGANRTLARSRIPVRLS